MIRLMSVLCQGSLELMTKWIWFYEEIVYIAAAILNWKGPGGMSESEHSGQKNVIIVAGIIGGIILFLGLAGVGLTLLT